MPKVNQQLIADKLDICRTTVSRCFSNHPKINPETRAKVLELAAQLGYRYSAQRAPRDGTKNQAKEIGVLIGVRPDMTELPVTSQYMLKGISERAAAQNLALDVRYIDPAELDDMLQTSRTPKGLRAGNGNWKGAITIFPFTPETIVNLSKRISSVSIAEDYSEGGIDCIDVDHHAGIYQMVSHLTELGHKRIGFLSWRYSVESPWMYRRFGAYVDSLFRLGIDFDPDICLNVRKGQNLDVDQLSETVAQNVRDGVTAWVCAADHQAYRLIADLKKQAIRVPEDCSITGFDGIETPPGLPQLTSIKVPFEEMGVSSVIRLLERMKNPAGHRRHNLVEGRVVLGQTTVKA